MDMPVNDPIVAVVQNTAFTVLFPTKTLSCKLSLPPRLSEHVGSCNKRRLNLASGGDRFFVGAVRRGDGACLALGLLEGHLDVAAGGHEGVKDGEEEHGDCVEDVLPVLHPECVSSSSLTFSYCSW